MKFGIGIIGCGNISGIYFENCARFSNVEVVACADLDIDRARSKANAYGIAKACSVDDLLADSSVDIVLNLTIPKAHVDVSLLAIAAGKHVYSEKPLGINRLEGLQIVDAAKLRGVRVGCAPDTFLGAGIQTCVKLIDDGAIGRPVAATAFMLCHGHESWHPDPAFYYQKGGGPMLDMGPYYMTALVAMIGPVKRAAGMTSKAFGERLATSKEAMGQRIHVEVPTHVAGLLEFENGAIGTIVTSFDVWGAEVPFIEIHGTEGSLSVPDPNSFGGPVRIRRMGDSGWSEVPLSHPYAENARGLGLADMAKAIQNNGVARASGELAFHVLDVMEAFQDSSVSSRYSKFKQGIKRPLAMATDTSL